MGLFRSNYNRPGPGVSKNEKKKNGFVRYFQLLFRKLTKLCQLNLIFAIPVAVAFGLFVLVNTFITTNVFISFLPFIIISPFCAGLTYVTRNFAREEHAFVWGDFKDAVKENWKPFLIHGIITYAVVSLMYVALSFYQAQKGSNVIFSVAFVVCLSLCLMFLFMQYYIPVMIVTFDLKLKDVYKNAAIFAVVGLGRNLLTTLILLVLAAIGYLMMMSLLTLFIGILLIILILFSLISFSVNFTIYPNIEKFLIKPIYEKENAPETDVGESDGEENRSVFRNMDVVDLEKEEIEAEKKEQPKVEYVYENGRLVRKSEVESVFNDDKK